MYAGCGTDVLPILALSGADGVKHWTLIDSQPASEFGHDTSPGFERPEFLKTIREKLRHIGFQVAYESWMPRATTPELVQFYNPKTQIIVNLWPSRALPFKHLPLQLNRDLSLCDIVIVMGHDPHESLLSYVKPMPVLVTDFKTVLDEPSPDGCIQHAETRFSSYMKVLVPQDIQKIWWQWTYEPEHRALVELQRHTAWKDML